MKRFWQENKKTIVTGALFLVAGLLFGSLFFGGSGRSGDQVDTEVHEHADQSTIWTCAMHPQIRQDEPGQCPICGMDLVPVDEAEGEEPGVGQIQLSESAARLADIQTIQVGASNPVKTITLQGKVAADERNIAQLTARFPGRIERLYINFTGQEVRKGEKLATIYSPELVAAQKELLEAIKFKGTNPEYYEAARQKLKLWDLSEARIDRLEQSGTPVYNVEVESPVTGTVTERMVATGDYVQEGALLFEVVDLSKVWLLFDAYESDLSWISKGDRIDYTAQALPGETFSSKVTFIDPIIDPKSRVAKVRAEVLNPGGKLKPDMFVRGQIQSPLQQTGEVLTIPKSAVLWTGKKAVVYVRDTTREAPTFEYREIQLGADVGDSYIVEDGLAAGEVIAANGVFRIDAAAQLQGKQSMMNPEGGKVSTGHDHGASVEMDEEQVPATFRKQLAEVAEPYLSIKDALVQGNVQSARKGAGEMQQSLANVDMSLLAGPAHDTWMAGFNQMQSALKKMEQGAGLDDIRKPFTDLSDALIKTLSVLGVTLPDKQVLFIQYCPMANDDTGGYWLSGSEEIRNPYFGDQMLTCGSVEGKIE